MGYYNIRRVLKSSRPKEGSTFLTKPLFPQGREDVTALRCSETLRYKVGGPSKVCARLCGLGPPGVGGGFRRPECSWGCVRTLLPQDEDGNEDNKAIIDAINAANPDLLWIGMTAPKQEKWTYSHWNELNIHCHVGTIGAVFDFFAGTVERAPIWWQEHGLEWLYRLMKEPKRMWRRYIIGNSLFLWNMTKE